MRRSFPCRQRLLCAALRWPRAGPLVGIYEGRTISIQAHQKHGTNAFLYGKEGGDSPIRRIIGVKWMLTHLAQLARYHVKHGAGQYEKVHVHSLSHSLFPLPTPLRLLGTLVLISAPQTLVSLKLNPLIPTRPLPAYNVSRQNDPRHPLCRRYGQHRGRGRCETLSKTISSASTCTPTRIPVLTRDASSFNAKTQQTSLQPNVCSVYMRHSTVILARE